MNETQKKLYQEALAILKHSQELLLALRAKHEAALGARKAA
jgi:hypothetical protein